MKLIVFEGIDKSGKTSIANLYRIQTSYKNLVLDRAFVSQLAYAEIYKRTIDKTKIYDWIKCIRNDLVFVYVTANKDILNKRLVESKHVHVNIENERLVFDKYIEKMELLGAKVIRIDTTNKTIEESVSYLLDKLEEKNE